MQYPLRTTRARAGFTLLEGLFALLLISLVLSSLAATLKGAARVRLASSGSGVAVEVDHIATLMRRDIAAALETQVGDKELVLKMIDPQRSYQERRVEDAFAEEFVMEVTYFYLDGRLHRQENRDDPEPADLLLELHDFEIERDRGLIETRFVQKTQGALKNYDYTFRKAEF